MTAIVLDTNVLGSGMINAFGPPGRIVDRLREGELQLVVDDRILAEYTSVLMRPKFSRYFKPSEARDVLIFLEHNGCYVVPTAHVPALPDPDDIPFLEVALSAGVPLVTGNATDYDLDQYPDKRIYTPAQFVGLSD